MVRFRDADFKIELKLHFSAIFEQIFCIFSIPVAYWLRGLKLGVRDSKWSTLARKKNLDFFHIFHVPAKSMRISPRFFSYRAYRSKSETSLRIQFKPDQRISVGFCSMNPSQKVVTGFIRDFTPWHNFCPKNVSDMIFLQESWKMVKVEKLGVRQKFLPLRASLE